MINYIVADNVDMLKDRVIKWVKINYNQVVICTTDNIVLSVLAGIGHDDSVDLYIDKKIDVYTAMQYGFMNETEYREWEKVQKAEEERRANEAEYARYMKLKKKFEGEQL